MTGKRLAALVGTLVAAIGCSAAVASAATASLQLLISPGAHANTNFSFPVKGTFKKSKLTGKNPKQAYVVILMQPASVSCDRSEPKDFAKRYVHVLWKGSVGSSSPFSKSVMWNKQATDQTYRLCAYLFSRALKDRFGNTDISHPGAGNTQFAMTTAIVPA